MIELKNVTKFYNNNNVVSLGLKNINLKLEENEIVAICGESGSGKSTLLNVITKIDTFDEGEIFVDGEETSYYDVKDMDEFRKNKVGFIFQNYNIIESYDVLHNVMLPFIISGVSLKEAKSRALELIDKVGLSNRIHNKGSHLSGGEKQRCVIARALASNCQILACDEPTGNLDSQTGKEIIKLLQEVAPGKIVLIVTHNFDEIKDIATRRIVVKDGNIIIDEKLKEIDNKVFTKDKIDNKNISLKTSLKIASDNLIYTPKKTIFMSLVYLFVSIAFLSLFLKIYF
ncbi:MAG: ABC transporter ATP-binding protein, partial [Acholeplasmatales bacterium]|nr:ABC transporter ATP-binding protein [Acholeplasmatales bacterium]